MMTGEQIMAIASKRAATNPDIEISLSEVRNSDEQLELSARSISNPNIVVRSIVSKTSHPKDVEFVINHLIRTFNQVKAKA